MSEGKLTVSTTVSISRPKNTNFVVGPKFCTGLMELLIHQKQLILTLDNRILESQKELVENHQLGSTLHYFKIDTGILILIPKKKHFFQI